jgi:hypothetical protein
MFFLNPGIVGSNPARGMNVCVCPLFVLFYVRSGLAMGWWPVQGVLPTVYEIQILELINSEWEQAREPNPSRKRKYDTPTNL